MAPQLPAPLPARLAEPVPAVPAAANRDPADPDAALIRLWLHGRPPATRRAYAGDVAGFLARAGTTLHAVTLADLQGFAASLAGVASATQARKLAAVKSLLAFGQRLGALPRNAGSMLRLPAVKATLAERILTEADIHRLLALPTTPRNAALLRLLYVGGLRIGEACGLVGRDLQPRDEAGQASVFGKGGTTRVVRLPASVWTALVALDPSPTGPVFRSAKGGHLDPSQVHRIVKAAAARAELPQEVSAHWLRHAHASHALDRGAPLHLVQTTLGHASIATTSRYLHARPNDSSARYLAV